MYLLGRIQFKGEKKKRNDVIIEIVFGWYALIHVIQKAYVIFKNLVEERVELGIIYDDFFFSFLNNFVIILVDKDMCELLTFKCQRLLSLIFQICAKIN